MKCVNYEIDKNKLNDCAKIFLQPGMLFWDIETTGLSSQHESIYCIGTGFMEEDESLVIRLYFAEDPSQEKEVIASFLCLAGNFQKMITFNGQTFDRNFVTARASRYGINFDWDRHEHVDLYRTAKSIRGFLNLKNYKQKTVEEWFGISREDLYNGGQLIDIYRQYTKDRDPRKLELLLLHNKEDIEGMFSLVSLLSYEMITDPSFTLTSLDLFTTGEGVSWLGFDFSYQSQLPGSISLLDECNRLMLRSCHGRLEVRVEEGCLKHYFDDYKQYVYLPEEDQVVHKSVGQFVDAAHRKPAKKEQCFVKKECRYVAVCAKSNLTFYRDCLKDRSSYLVLPECDPDTWTDDPVFMAQAEEYLKTFLNWKKQN